MDIRKIAKDNKTVINTAVCSMLGFGGLANLIKHGGWSLGTYWYIIYLMVVPFAIFTMHGLMKLIESDGESSRKICKYAFVFGLLFGISTDMGYQLQHSGYTFPGLKGKLVIFITGVMLSFLMLPITYRLFRLAAGMYGTGQKRESKKGGCAGVFISVLVTLMLCWLPVFLAFYPAVMSYDFHRQSQEAMKGFIWFYEYQPLAHTFLIRQFFLLGLKLGDLGKGMAFYSVFQSLILASSISAAITFVYKRSGIVPVIFWTLVFALLPFNPILAISVTKDIIFSAFFVFVILLAYKMDEGLKVPVCILFVICGIINILFRNNALYGLIFLIPAFCITEKTVKKKIIYALITLVMIVSGSVSKTMIRTGMDAIRGSKMEMYSVPLMQMVRVVHYQSANLSPEQEEILHRYISDNVWNEYNPSIADAFKSNAPRDAWLEDQGQLVKDYLKIGRAYPNDYIDAFLSLTLGYWFIDDKTHAEMLDVGDDSGLGLLFTFNASTSEVIPDGIENRSYIPSLYSEYKHIVNGNSYYNWPVVSLLFKPALYFWILVYAVFVCVLRRNKKSLLILTYPVFYMLTMLLGPCVHFRYIYPFILAAPLFISIALSETDK